MNNISLYPTANILRRVAQSVKCLTADPGVASSILAWSLFKYFVEIDEEIIYLVNTIYWHCGHLGHVTKIFCIHFGLFIIRSLHMKFEFNWASDL